MRSRNGVERQTCSLASRPGSGSNRGSGSLRRFLPSIIRSCLMRSSFSGERDMTLTTFGAVFGVGFAGGVLLELLHWYTIRQDEHWPQYARSPVYWLISLAMAVAGGGLTLLYFGAKADGLVALHVGISTPLILQKLSTTLGTTPGAKGLQASPIQFMRW